MGLPMPSADGADNLLTTAYELWNST